MVDIDRERGFAVQSNNVRPTFQFSNLLDFAQDLPFSQSGPTIDIAKGNTAIDLNRKLFVLYTSAYLQDDWKVSQRVTINAGWGQIRLYAGQLERILLPAAGLHFPDRPERRHFGYRVLIGGMDTNPNPPRTHDWTFSVQRGLGSSFVAETDYLGSQSDNLYTQTDVNRYAGDLVQHNGALTRLNPSFGPIVFGRTFGTSDAHIFSFALGRRFAHGWSAKAIYTTGRALDADSSNDNGVGGGRNILDAYNIEAQRGRADYDIKRRLTFDSVWEVPSPVHGGALKAVLGGWRLSTIAMFSSGRPFAVFSSSPYPNGDFNADGFNWDVPNAPAFGDFVSASRSDFIRGLFKSSDFPRPARGQRGDLGRNTFEGPDLANVNLNVIKATKIPWFLGGEGATVELRGEIFNLFNRVNLTSPSSNTVHLTIPMRPANFT